MPAAGQIIRALDFEGAATDSDTADELNFNSTSYTLGSTTVGTAFVAPTSGTVDVTCSGRIHLNSATAIRILLAAEVRTGSTVGSGTVIAAANDNFALEVGQAANSRVGASRTRRITGLTAGVTYNVSLWHKNATSVVGGTQAGTVFDRDVIVTGVV